MDNGYGHYYDSSGNLVAPWEPGAWPSPTTILDILPKPELEAWRRVQGENLADELMRDAQERGTRVHEAVEQLLCDEDVVTGVHEEDLPFINGFVNWWNSHDVHLVETELFLESKLYKFRGRTDIIVVLDGDWWIIDLKTGATRWTHAYQLKFYEQANYEMTGQHCRMGVLSLTNKTKKGWRSKEYKKPLYRIISLKNVFDDYMKENPIKQPKEVVEWQG